MSQRYTRANSRRRAPVQCLVVLRCSLWTNRHRHFSLFLSSSMEVPFERTSAFSLQSIFNQVLKPLDVKTKFYNAEVSQLTSARSTLLPS